MRQISFWFISSQHGLIDKPILWFMKQIYIYIYIQNYFAGWKRGGARVITLGIHLLVKTLLLITTCDFSHNHCIMDFNVTTNLF